MGEPHDFSFEVQHRPTSAVRAQVRAFLEGLRDPSHTLYAQRQNSSLSEEFSELLPDVGPLPAFAEAFGAPAEAVNIWIGGCLFRRSAQAPSAPSVL